MDYYCFELKPTTDCDELWEELLRQGYQLLYSVEEPGQPAQIFGYPPAGIKELNSKIARALLQTFEAIDWQAQWKETVGSDGSLQLKLADYLPDSKDLVTIYPGPGFGDLSHPTTKQTLQMAAPLAKGKFILDVGSGSGILSLAVAQLGAFKVHGIDIDADAIAHANVNAQRNVLKAPVSFAFPWDPLEYDENMPLLILMNMITSEQKVAWNSLEEWHSRQAEIITSGVLIEQRNEYLTLTESWGWQLINESCLEGWQAFHFRNAGLR